MPNWVYNSLIADSEATMKWLHEQMIDNGKVTFNKLVPMPVALENTRAPLSVLPDLDFRKKFISDKEAHDCADMRRLEKGEYIRDPAYPIVVAISETAAGEYRQKYGALNWYDWRLSNWGVKWDCCEPEYDFQQIHFETPWSHPYAFMERLAERLLVDLGNDAWIEWYFEEETGWGGIALLEKGTVVYAQEWEQRNADQPRS